MFGFLDDLDFAAVGGFDSGNSFDYGSLDLSGLEGGFEFPGYGGWTPSQIFEPASLGFTLRNCSFIQYIKPNAISLIASN